MHNELLIEKTQNYVQSLLQSDCTGHDWWHIERVFKLATHIALQEKADVFIVQLAALLHDIADWKFDAEKNEKSGAEKARSWLLSLEVAPDIANHVADIILHMSFKGAGVSSKISTLEGKVVQDADRLDAIGAIGIARTFAYGGAKLRPIHDPSVQPTMHESFEAYKNSKGTTINHFYEKLLLLKNLMQTKTAQKIAEERHIFMEKFLKQFFLEWEAKDIAEYDLVYQAQEL